MAPAFIGREAELALLDDIYLRAKREERPAAAASARNASVVVGHDYDH